MKAPSRQKNESAIPSEILTILGTPPLLSSENEKTYYLVIASLAKEIAPTDVILWILIKDFADYYFEVTRLRRVKVSIIQNAHDAYIRDQVKNLNGFLEVRRMALDEKAKTERKSASSAAPEKKEETERRLKEIDEKLKADLANAEKENLAAVAELETRVPQERDLALALDRWIDVVQKVDMQLDTFEKRFSVSLREIERYRFGLARRLREELGNVIEGEVTEFRVEPLSMLEATKIR